MRREWIECARCAVSEDRKEIKLEGDCCVEHAAEIHGKICSAMKEAETVVLDLSGVERADVSLQQLICSAHRSFFRSGRRLVLTGHTAAPVLEVFRTGGFGRGCFFRREQCLFQEGADNE